MAESHLNGSYYGPSIPPRKDYHRHGRSSGGCGCCGCLFGCLCNCILSLIFKIVFTVIVIIGLAVLIIWLILRPNNLKFHVTDAALTQFNLSTTDNMLQYNLALNVTVRNPNKRIGIYYDTIQANAYYEDQRFDSESLTRFYQGHKNTTVLSPVFAGQHLVSLGTSEVSKFNSEKSNGIYSIDLKLRLRIRVKVGWIKFGHFKPKINCGLKVPLSSNGSSASSFETTKCSYDL